MTPELVVAVAKAVREALQGAELKSDYALIA